MPLLDVPATLWAYAVLRSLAFAAPTWAGGNIGLGVVVVAALYVFALRRSRRAWSALVVLDVLSLTMLVAAWLDASGSPIAAPLLTALSFVVLVLPASRRYVCRGRSAVSRSLTPRATGRVSRTGATS